jgi:hypothetical protein
LRKGSQREIFAQFLCRCPALAGYIFCSGRQIRAREQNTKHPLGCFYLNFASNLACNEKRTATKQENLEWHPHLGHPFGGFRRITDANKTRYSKGFFRCGSLFVAKLRFYPLALFFQT